ncbi:MAG: CBS domain-containing protein [Chloroflexi bacterium]|nr:CBS domain-containing protein [Chloroflexota bacterium]
MTTSPITARDLMTSQVITLPPDATILDAAELMIRHKIGCVPVVNDQGELLGLVTESDFFPQAQGIPFSGQTVPQLFHQLLGWSDLQEVYRQSGSLKMQKVATRPAETIQEDTPLAKIAQLMLHDQVNHLPVVRGKKLVGIVSRHDLLRAVLRSSGAS